jgi:hypothetical protein
MRCTLAVPVPMARRFIAEVDGNAIVKTDPNASGILVTVEAKYEASVALPILLPGGRLRAARLRVGHLPLVESDATTTTIVVPPTITVDVHAGGWLHAFWGVQSAISLRGSVRHG